MTDQHSSNPMGTVPEGLPDAENPYVMGEVADRARLIAQSRLFSQYVETHAREFVPIPVKRILDMGCGQGQLALVLAKVFPDATIIGVDRDIKAINAASAHAAAHPNLRFETMDVQKQLPEGPFDLIFASALFQHLHTPDEVLTQCFQRLNPGGYIWTKDGDMERSLHLIHPVVKEFITILYSVIDASGGHAYVCNDIKGMMEKAGFRDIQQHDEAYDFGSHTSEGRVSVSIALVAFHNARSRISTVKGIPEADLNKYYLEACELLMKPDGPQGKLLVQNSVGRKIV